MKYPSVNLTIYQFILTLVCVCVQAPLYSTFLVFHDIMEVSLTAAALWPDGLVVPLLTIFRVTEQYNIQSLKFGTT